MDTYLEALNKFKIGLKIRHDIYPISKGKVYEKGYECTREFVRWFLRNKIDVDCRYDKVIDLSSTSPVFICGIQKSGTTLLSQLLDGHKNVLVFPGEGYYEEGLRLGRKYYGRNDIEISRYWLIHFLTSIRTYPMLVLGDREASYRRFMCVLLRELRHSKQQPFLAALKAISSFSDSCGIDKFKYWVEKTPGNENSVPRLLKAHSDAKFINIIRHPFSNIASFRKWRKLRGGEYNLKTIVKSVKFKLQSAIRNKESLEKNVYYVVKYEDLVHNVKKETAKIAFFLKIQPASELCVPTELGIPCVSNSLHKKDVIVGEVKDLSTCRRFKKELTIDEQAYIKCELKTEINYFWGTGERVSTI